VGLNRYLQPIFTAALFTVVNRGSNSMPSMDEWIFSNVVYTYNRILFSLKMEGNSSTLYNTDEP
jgi:hypothetical protein